MRTKIMVEEDGNEALVDTQTAEEWLSQARELVPVALEKAREVRNFPGRWKVIVTELEQIPNLLSDLSTHPCFSKSALCKEQLQAILKTLNEEIELADLCVKEKFKGKLRMQSDLDALSAKLDLYLTDCGILIKTGVLGESVTAGSSAESGAVELSSVRELLARLQIGDLEAKHKAVDSLIEMLKFDEKDALTVLERSNIAALVQLLTANSPKIRQKSLSVICSLAESNNCEDLVANEGVIPALIRLVEFGNTNCKEKATITLQKLSSLPETARSIVVHNGVRPLIKACQTGDSFLQAAAACTLKNISAVPEVRQNLAEEGIVTVMIDLLDCGILMGSKDYAAECLQNLSSSNETLRRSIASEGGIRSLLAHIDGPSPQESSVGALKNLVGSVSAEKLVAIGLIPRLAHILKSGSLGAQQACSSIIFHICSSREMKRAVGEVGCVPLLVQMLEAKTDVARSMAVQALWSLLTVSQNCREVKRVDKCVPNLVRLLEPGYQNSAKKYAVACLALISSSKKCKKLMISSGAIVYLVKLSEMEIPGAKTLLQRLERGKFKSLFGMK